MEAYHLQGRGSSHVRIGVKLEKTRYVNSQIGSAVNEKQVIRVMSTEHPETQVKQIPCEMKKSCAQIVVRY